MSGLMYLPLSDAQRFAALFAAQQPVEDHAGYEHSREQIREQTKTQRDRETANRTSTEDEQNHR